MVAIEDTFRAESSKIFELQTKYVMVMDTVLSSCSISDFKSFSTEKHRIQGSISIIKAMIDNLKDKKLARDRIRNKIKLTAIPIEDKALMLKSIIPNGYLSSEI